MKDVPADVLERSAGQPIADNAGDAPTGWRRWLPTWPPSVPQAVILVLALCLLAGMIGWRVAQPGRPGTTSVDAGFLDDMQAHHEQALALSFAYLDVGSDPLLRQSAREIIMFQGTEIGLMRGILSEWDYSVDPNATDIAHEWLGAPVPIEEMPGMASVEDFEELNAAAGREADEIYSRLMIRHHDGGIHMADDAAANAETEKVRQLAGRMASTQRAEIRELNWARFDLGLSPVGYRLSPRNPVG
ncbi:MAG: DUF305 domain-containing protein [Acidimicrobiia bacterium]